MPMLNHSVSLGKKLKEVRTDHELKQVAMAPELNANPYIMVAFSLTGHTFCNELFKHFFIALIHMDQTEVELIFFHTHGFNF